jgi:hypothetical protein
MRAKMRLAPTICSIILLLAPLLVPAIAVSSDQKYPEPTNGEPVITAVSSNQECPEFANGESAITLVSSNQTYPEFFNGCPVIFVETSENTYSLPPNLVILVIFDDSNNSTEGSMESFDDYLSNHQLPEGWSISVIGGPGFSSKEDALKEFLEVHDSFNNAIKENGGPFKMGPVPSG